MLVGHALDALETADARVIVEHLATCAACRDEFDAWKETSASLAYAAEPSIPSTAVRASILEQVRTLANSTPIQREESIGASANKSAKEISKVVPLPNRTGRGFHSRELFSAIAASLLIALLMVAIVVLWQRKRATETEITRLSQRVSETQQELARLLEEKRLFTAPTARVASLAGTEMAKEAHAMLAYDHVTGRAMLVANGLPQAPAGMAYQLWYIPEGKHPMPGGVFAADAAGHAELSDVVPPEGLGAAVFAVTLEHAGGVLSPEGKAYLKSSASS